MLKSWEGYDKNWIHFVYKKDNLSRSIRVSNENSSLTKGFHFFWTYLNSILFVCSKCTIQRHITKFQQFLTSFGILCAFTFFELVDPEIEKHYKWTLKMLKVVMLSSFHPHSMCEKVKRVKAKTGWTSCTKRTISFEVSGFHTETRLLQRDFIFFELIWTP